VSITVVGSIAYDAVTTPFGERERMLGGAATHFALAASLFDRVNLVGCVGSDFADEDMGLLSGRGDTTDVRVVDGGKTFFWRGEYGWDINVAHTLDTQLGVFEHFEPSLSAGSSCCDVLFLANIQPGLQLQVREQCRQTKFVALDSMNLWIDVARDDLADAISRVDCVILNDAELRQFAKKANLTAAARDVLAYGPTAVVAKQGEYGAALFTSEHFFSIPAYPLESIVDPTGAGDSFAGGFLGYVSQHGTDYHSLRRAMAYGTAVASFNVEEFGTERVRRLTFEDVHERVLELELMTRFDLTREPVA
jgi:sugar/nucleoside kinase (ribokinase family)